MIVHWKAMQSGVMKDMDMDMDKNMDYRILPL